MRKAKILLILMTAMLAFSGCGKKDSDAQPKETNDANEIKVWESTTDAQKLADFYVAFKEANTADSILSEYDEYTVVSTTSYNDGYSADFIDTVQRTKDYGHRKMNLATDEDYYDFKNNTQVSTEEGKVYAHLKFYEQDLTDYIGNYTGVVGVYEEANEVLTELVRNEDGTYTITSKFGTDEDDYAGHMDAKVVYQADSELRCTSVNCTRDFSEYSEYNSTENIVITYGGEIEDYASIFKHVNPTDGEKCTVKITDVETDETKSIDVDAGTRVYVDGSIFGMTAIYEDEACTREVEEIVAKAGEQQYYISVPANEQDLEMLNEISIANPMMELTDEEEIAELSYGLILPKGAENVENYLINEYILERMFDVDGVSYTMRVATGDEYEDISGMYYDWTYVTDIHYPTDKTVHMTFSSDDEYADVFNWYDEELSVNYSVSSIDNNSQISILIDQMIPLSVKNRKTEEEINAVTPGLPPISNIEEGFGSFVDWVGLQSFYDGIEFEEATDEIKVAIAVFCAQSNETEMIIDETGCNQIISEDKIKQAMMDLFGETYDIKASDEICEKSHFEIMDDKSVYVGLGDWGLVRPEVDIISAEPGDEAESVFYVSALYYPHDLETDHISFNIANYLCRCKCVLNENSKYGFSIIEMDGSIEE